MLFSDDLRRTGYEGDGTLPAIRSSIESGRSRAGRLRDADPRHELRAQFPSRHPDVVLGLQVQTESRRSMPKTEQVRDQSSTQMLCWPLRSALSAPNSLQGDAQSDELDGDVAQPSPSLSSPTLSRGNSYLQRRTRPTPQFPTPDRHEETIKMPLNTA